VNILCFEHISVLQSDCAW